MVLAMTACGSGSSSKTTEKAAETTAAAESAKEITAEAKEETAEETAGAVMPKASGEKLVIGTLANWVGLPAWYAYAEGYYEEVGLDVEIVNFGSQGTLVILPYPVWLLYMLFLPVCISISGTDV